MRDIKTSQVPQQVRRNNYETRSAKVLSIVSFKLLVQEVLFQQMNSSNLKMKVF